MAEGAAETKTSPEIQMLEVQLSLLVDPKGGEQNKRHFVLPDGNVVLKCAPWIDPENGDQITEEPLWTQMCLQSTNVDKADFIENLPNPTPGARGVRELRNPLTGEVKEKIVPWWDQEKGVYLLAEYRAGLRVLKGDKIQYQHNPDQEFDDPADDKNQEFLLDPDMAINTTFSQMDTERRVVRTEYSTGPKARLVGGRRNGKDTAIIGVNLGGTIMMESTPDGLVPSKLGIGEVFKKHLRSSFKNCAVSSFAFKKNKPTQDSPEAYGIDSSQMEIDFIGDLAVSMVSI